METLTVLFCLTNVYVKNRPQFAKIFATIDTTTLMLLGNRVSSVLLERLSARIDALAVKRYAMVKPTVQTQMMKTSVHLLCNVLKAMEVFVRHLFNVIHQVLLENEPTFVTVSHSVFTSKTNVQVNYAPIRCRNIVT
uniref:Uncharacterized protein n=1 Tax=Ciona intestinalis TaxID=7719 RepID=H2XUQ4_CIOIN